MRNYCKFVIQYGIMSVSECFFLIENNEKKYIPMDSVSSILYLVNLFGVFFLLKLLKIIILSDQTLKCAESICKPFVTKFRNAKRLLRKEKMIKCSKSRLDSRCLSENRFKLIARHKNN